MRRLLACYAAIALICLARQAWYTPQSGAPQNQSSPTSNQKRYKVTGTVVNSSTNEPIGHAMVEFRGQEARSIMTGLDGRFEIDDLLGGNTFVMARRPGFNPATRQVPVVVGESSDSVTVKLEPLAKISGRILDREGEPIEGIALQCSHETINNGRKQLRPAHGANTDETGNFEIEDLAPGRYFLSTVAKQLYQVPDQNSEPARYVYPSSYYPDSSSRDTAQPIGLTPGQDFKIEMTLGSVRGVHVTVNTVPRDPNIMAAISADGTGPASITARANKAGTFIFGAVPPGSWKIVVAGGPFARGRQQSGAQPMYGELPINADTADLENLTIPLNNLADILVQVSGDVTNGIMPQLISKDGMVNSADMGGDNSFHSVQPGSYRLQISSANACVTSAMSGSTDLLKEELVVSPGAAPAPIIVTTSNSCPQVNVTLTDANYGVLVVTRDSSSNDARIFGLGNSELRITLAPGGFKLYAFDDINDLEYANPEAMRNFKSQSISLEGNQQVSVRLEVNQRRAQ